MRQLGAWLARCHQRGVHVAVLAGVVMMPAVIATGFWTDRGPPPRVDGAGLVSSGLRGSLADPDNIAPPGPAEP